MYPATATATPTAKPPPTATPLVAVVAVVVAGAVGAASSPDVLLFVIGGGGSLPRRVVAELQQISMPPLKQCNFLFHPTCRGKLTPPMPNGILTNVPPKRRFT